MVWVSKVHAILNYAFDMRYFFIKNTKTLVFVIFSLFAIANIVSATSGACSDHGGVNCAAGIGNMGANAVCNDGFESSTSYYDTGECIGKLSPCAQPVKTYCTTPSDIRAHCGAPSQYTSDMYDICVNNCQTQINKYQSDLANYNGCVSNQSSNSSNTTTTPDYKMQEYCVDLFGSSVTYNSAKGTCDCNTGYVLDSSRKCSIAICPSNASYANGQCTCNVGYVSNSNGDSCITATQGCQSLYGPNSYADSSNRCYCNDGYQFNSSKQCVTILTPPPTKTHTPAPIPMPAPTPTIKPSKLLEGITVGQPATPKTNGLDYRKITSDPSVKVTTPAATPKKSTMEKIWNFIKSLFGK